MKLPPEMFASYTKFAVIRNPYDRAVSLFHFLTQKESHHRHKTVRDMTFHRFLEHVSVLSDALRRHALEADARGLDTIVVATDAILLHRRQLALCRGGLRSAGLLRRSRLLRRCGQHTRQRRDERDGSQRDDDGAAWGSFHLLHSEFCILNYASGDRYAQRLSKDRRTNSSPFPITASNSFVGFASTASLGPRPLLSSVVRRS